MSDTWYQVAHGRWHTGELKPVEVVKETAKTIWIKDLYWKCDRIDKQAKVSGDYRYFSDRDEALEYQKEVVNKKIEKLEKEIVSLTALIAPGD